MIVWMVSSSLLILLIAALRLLLRGRLSLRVQYALWLLVLLRLLIPGSPIPGRVSVGALLPPAAAALPLALPEAEPAQPAVSALSAAGAPAEIPALGGETAAAAAPSPAALSPAAWLRLFWLGGAALLLLAGEASHLRFLARLRRSRRLVSEGEAALPVYSVRWLATPCLAGLLRPAVYLTENLTEDERRHVLAHEQTHYRHGDLFWSQLRLLALALHWYNPLVWLAAVLSKRDAELACDEATLRVLGDRERYAYGETLLRLSMPRRGSLLELSTAMTDSKRALAERIRCIARRPRTALTTLALVLALSLCASLFAFTGASAEVSPDDVPGGETILSEDGTVTAELDLPASGILFPDGAPVLNLRYHTITPEEMRRIVGVLFGDDTPVWQDFEENLYLERPFGTQETLDRWVAEAREALESGYLEPLAESNETLYGILTGELESLIASYAPSENAALYNTMPTDAQRKPMVWDGSVSQAVCEKDGISYRISNRQRVLPEPAYYTLNVVPEDTLAFSSGALNTYFLYSTFGGSETLAQPDRIARQAEGLVEQMGLTDRTLQSCAPITYGYYGSSEGSAAWLVQARFEHRYDLPLPMNDSPSSIIDSVDTIQFEFSVDGRLVRMHDSAPLELAETVTEHAAVLSWEDTREAVRSYLRQATATRFGYVATVTPEQQQIQWVQRAKVRVTSLKAGFSRIEKTPGAEDWQIIPTIAVYGDLELSGEDGEPLSTEGASWAVLHTPGKPLFLLSALDGSLVEDLITPYLEGEYFNS